MSHNQQSLDLTRLTGYVLGAGFFVWLGGGGLAPLVVSGVALLLLRRVVSELK